MRLASLGLLAALMTALLAPPPTQAQTSSRYDNPALGLAFDVPAGWATEQNGAAVSAGAPSDLAALRAGASPEGPVLRVAFGTFAQLGIADAAHFPDLLTRLVPRGAVAAAPQPVTWGGATGVATEVTLTDDALTTRVALLAVAGGRIAVLRMLAPAGGWADAQVAFDTILNSLQFRAPARDAALLANLDVRDGGVLWQYQAAPPEDGRVVRAGGVLSDPFDVLYLAVGPGGVLSLNLSDGSPVAYIGPWSEGDYADIAIGPRTLLFLANAAPDSDEAITVVDRAGNYGRGWGLRGDGDGQFAPGMPRTIAVTPTGEVWAASEGHTTGIAHRLYRFDAWGTLLQTVDLAALNPNLAGVHIAYSPHNEALYVVGESGGLNVLDAAGAPLVSNLAQDVLQDLTPTDVALTADGSIVVALQAPGLEGYGFLLLSDAGRLLDAFGAPYDAARGGPFQPGEYRAPAGLLVAADGSVLWAETNPDTGLTQLQRFAFSGEGSVTAADNARPDLAGLVGSSDPAQGGGTITPGQSVRGALNNEFPVHEWTFEGRAGDHVQISLVDASGVGLLDPALWLKDPHGREIAGNDDVGDVRPDGLSRRDAFLDFFLSSSGIFAIEAGRFGGRGDYVLTLEVLSK